jgi:hypothetical protein
MGRIYDTTSSNTVDLGAHTNDQYGFLATDYNNDILFEISETYKRIAGWGFTSNTLSKGDIELISSGTHGKIKVGTTDFWDGDTSFKFGGDNGIYKGSTGNISIGSDVDINGNLNVGILPKPTLDDKLELYFSFDAGSLKAEVGNTSVSNTGDVLFTKGAVNDAAVFDGSNYLDVVPNYEVDWTSEAKTIDFWMKLDSLTPPSPNESFRLFGNDGSHSFIDVKTTGTKFTFRGEQTNNSTYLSPLDSLIDKDTEWHKITFVIKDGNWKLYIDGKFQDSASTTPVTSGGSGKLDILFFGHGKSHNYYGANFIGKLDEFKVYNGEFTAEEIKSLYLNPAQKSGVISANKIRTGVIQSSDWDGSSLAGYFATTGTKIDLSDGSVLSKSFKIDSSGNASFIGDLTATGGSFTGAVTAGDGGNIVIDGVNSKIYLGTGVYNNTNTEFYVDNAGQFSLGDKFTWDGTSLNITGSGTFSGTINASDGVFTGAVTVASGSSMAFGKGVSGANDGLKITDNDYIYDTGAFSFGGGALTGTASSLAIDTDDFNLASTNITLTSNSGGSFAVGTVLTADGATNTGTFAGWSFSEDALYKNSLFLSSVTDSTGLYLEDADENKVMQVGDFPLLSTTETNLFSNLNYVEDGDISGSAVTINEDFTDKNISFYAVSKAENDAYGDFARGKITISYGTLEPGQSANFSGIASQPDLVGNTGGQIGLEDRISEVSVTFRD